MAVSANRLLAPSWAQVWIAAFGLIGLTLSLLFTAWSLLQTRLALRSQRETAELDMRAYVGAESIARKGFKVGQRPEFAFNIKNFGNTPAYDVMTVLSVKIIPQGGEPNFASGDLDMGIVINPGGVIVLSEKLPALTQEMFDSFKGDELGDGASISLVLDVHYRTLGKPRKLKISMIFWGPLASHSKVVNEHSSCD